MRIGLLTTLNTNIGDDFIREGIIDTVLRLRKGLNTDFISINKHDPFSAYTSWQLRLKRFLDCRPRSKKLQSFFKKNFKTFPWSRFDSCDLIIQCGTPVLWYGCQYSEWANPIWREIFHRLSKSGKPILNIGAGATYPWEKRPSTLIGDHDEHFVRLMLDSCKLTTVRDTLAKKLFQSLDYDVDIICCPALLAGQVYASPTQPSRKVVINYMEGGGHYDWDQGIDKNVWHKAMISVVSELTKHGWNVTLLAHDQKESELARTIWPNLACYQPKTPKEYFEFIKDAAFGIFNRMHASVAAAGLGIPSIAIGTDARNLMVAQIGLPVFYVKEASADVMIEATWQLMEQRQVVSARLLDLTEKTQKQYEVLLAHFV